MGRYIRWQAILAFTGIAMTLAFLSFLALSRTTETVPDVGGVYTEAIAGKPQFINPCWPNLIRPIRILSRWCLMA